MTDPEIEAIVAGIMSVLKPEIKSLAVRVSLLEEAALKSAKGDSR